MRTGLLHVFPPLSDDENKIRLLSNGFLLSYLTGFTNSSDFPTTPNSFQPNRPCLGNVFSGLPGGCAFVTKLSPTGTLVYSTYLGGNGPSDSYAE